MHLLTVEARDAVEESGLGKRQIARLLGTSPSQLYRLLDPTYPTKSLGQMLNELWGVVTDNRGVPYVSRYEVGPEG